MSIIKDLLYTRGNRAAELARSSAAFSVLLYWGCVYYEMVWRDRFDAVNTGLGLASVVGAFTAWIHFRQKHEETITHEDV